jgi:D-proline reductase (dithiol) PrdB
LPRLEDLDEDTRERLFGLECPSYTTKPWVAGPPLPERTVGIVTSAALHHRAQRPFLFGTPEWRELPASLPTSDIVMSHVSINFDRSGFQRDLNVAYPIDRLREAVEQRRIGAMADTNVSVMGSSDPKDMQDTSSAIVAHFKRRQVDTVFLVPV